MEGRGNQVTTTSERMATVGDIDEALIKTTEDLIPDLAARADEAERQAGLPAETITALDNLGIRRMVLPRSAGGLESSPRTILGVMEALARGCASTSFVNT